MIEVFKYSDDDSFYFYPELVKIEFIKHDNKFYINVVGQDDFDLVYVYSNENKCLCDFIELLGKPVVNFESLKFLSGERP